MWGCCAWPVSYTHLLRPTVTLYEIEAPLVAKKAQPGQFIILRVDENGERIPITINDYNPEKGTVTTVSYTHLAKAIVACIAKTGQHFGVGVIAETLCGADTERVLSLIHI